MLLKFKAEKSLTGELKSTITEKGALGRSHSQTLEEIRQDKGILRGSDPAEAQHAQKSERIGTLAKHWAEAIGTNTHEGKHYRLQIETDSLKIFAKDGRGEIFSQQGKKNSSQLTQQDFARFEQLTEQRAHQSVKHYELE